MQRENKPQFMFLRKVSTVVEEKQEQKTNLERVMFVST